MRSLIFIAIASLACACGAPDVDLPSGNDALTSDQEKPNLPAPDVAPPPARYPYKKLVLRGKAVNGARVIVTGAGNPGYGIVQPVNNDFCVEVDLASAPAQYNLTIQSHSEGGEISEATEVVVNRDSSAPAPTNAKDCKGSPLS